MTPRQAGAELMRKSRWLANGIACHQRALDEMAAMWLQRIFRQETQKCA